MAENVDLDMLGRVTEIEDFFGAAIFRDELEDWGLARHLGNFLPQAWAEDPGARLLLAKAYRHFVDLARAAGESVCALQGSPSVPKVVCSRLGRLH